MIPIQPTSPMMMTLASYPSNKFTWITSTHLLDTSPGATVKADLLAILTIDKDITEYHWELQLIITV
jgi:hypothetical protein